MDCKQKQVKFENLCVLFWTYSQKYRFIHNALKSMESRSARLF